MSIKKGGKIKKQDSRKCDSSGLFWKDKTVILLSALTVALAFVVILLLPQFVRDVVTDQGVVNGETNEETPLYRHPITGAPLYEPVESPRLFGVMIDNHVDAWPPSGIDKAPLVIEAPVEAGISRMLAFFTDEQVIEQIGPIRSARPYYLDWNNELDAVYVHVGGSNAALDLIASGGTFDMNQYWYGDYFWRSSLRDAPHNVYTSTDELIAFTQAREEAGKAPTVLYGVWSFKDAEEPSESPVGLHVDFWAPTYSADWTYDSESRRYVREQGGSAHVTTEGDQIMADNVAVVITDVKIIDAVGRREIRTLGEGEGYVFQDGQVIQATWKKPSESERLRFYEGDQEIVMNAGVTWIEVVPDQDSIEFIETE